VLVATALAVLGEFGPEITVAGMPFAFLNDELAKYSQ
jgi:hypothetical protein